METGDTGDSHARPSPSAERRGACSDLLVTRSRRLPDTSTLIVTKRSPLRIVKSRMTLIAGGFAEGGNPSLTDDGAAIATRDYVDVTAIRVVADPRRHDGAPLGESNLTPLARLRTRACAYWYINATGPWRSCGGRAGPVRFDMGPPTRATRSRGRGGGHGRR